MVDPPAPRHAQVKDYRVAAIGVDETIFRAAAEPRHESPRKALTEVFRESMAQVRSPRLDAGDPPALEDAFQSANGSLDFGKLRHRRDMAKAQQAR